MSVLTIPESELERFTEEVLLAHNIYRLRHHACPLVLDDELCKECEECALEILGSEEIDSTRFPDRGENICILDVTDEEYMPSGDVPVTDWYNQRHEMDPSIEPEENENRGVNFCQLVWKASQTLGVGVARTATKIVIVCHYMPKGNVAGESVTNVKLEPAP